MSLREFADEREEKYAKYSVYFLNNKEKLVATYDLDDYLDVTAYIKEVRPELTEYDYLRDDIHSHPKTREKIEFKYIILN